MLPNTGLIHILREGLDSLNHASIALRHDLGSCAGADDSIDNSGTKEFMPQIMWPSVYLEGGIENSEVHQRIIQLARQD